MNIVNVVGVIAGLLVIGMNFRPYRHWRLALGLFTIITNVAGYALRHWS